MEMILIFSPYRSPRLHYACEILFAHSVQPWKLVHDTEVWKKAAGVKLEYAPTSMGLVDSLFIKSEEILWQNGVQEHAITPGQWENLPTLYAQEGSIPFDIFSAIFYLITRYEEYLPFEGDSMGRYQAAHCIASRHGFLHRPLIDLWRQKFEQWLITRWPELKFEQSRFSFLSTIDVDSAFAYKHKGFKRTLGGIAKDVLSMNFKNLIQRLATLAGRQSDCYDTYAFITQQCNHWQIENLYFFQLSNFGTYDKNVPHTSRSLRQLVNRLAENHTIGIHPGVASNQSSAILKIEKERLESITLKPCESARQHYLMLRFPSTYRSYLEVGIANDYTMGFADDVGFRASTSQAFYWFDLLENKKTTLKVHPFAAMDTTMNRYLGFSIEQSIEVLDRMMMDVCSTGGKFILLWHNETLSDRENWKGWRKVWQTALQLGRTKSSSI